MDHQSIRYKEKVLDDVKAADCAPEQIGSITRYSVVCRACSGHFTVDSHDSYRARIFHRSTAQPAQAVVAVVCECGFDHAGRPETGTFEGCGAAWQLIP